MKKTLLTTFAVLVAGVMGANALSINDTGVVGTIEAGTQNAGQASGNETEWANYLLGLGDSVTTTVDGNTPVDGTTENYATSSTDYNGTLTGAGTRINSATPDVSSYTWVLAKYDGQNAGYVLFYMPDYGTSVPEYPANLWTTTADQYQLSHVTAWGGGGTTVPDAGATLALMGLALMGLEGVRRKVRR